MKFITIVLVLFCYEARCTTYCRLAEDVTDESLDSPELAKTISIGVLAEENSKLFYTSIAPFESSKFEVLKSGCMGYGSIHDRGVVLLTSQKSINELQGKVLDISNARFSKLSEIDFFAEAIGKQRDELPLGQPNKFWKYCFNDLFCTKVQSTCGRKIGINGRFKALYEKYLKEHTNDTKCEKKNAKEEKKSQCIQNFCS